MNEHVDQLQEYADRLARALELQAGRLIEVEQENSRLRSTVATLTTENSQLRAMVSAVKAAVTP
jgi:23S rRNA pseudoU1915 N3-methylase RlmH